MVHHGEEIEEVPHINVALAELVIVVVFTIRSRVDLQTEQCVNKNSF